MTLSYKYRTFSIPLSLMLFLKRRMRWVRAAGCVLHDDAGNMLLIRRNGRWDLPKGKVEAGETLLQAAMRETEEETGIRPAGPMPSALPTRRNSGMVKTYHIFNLYGGWHLKQTTWFRVSCAGAEPAGTPQREEGIAEVVWVSPDEWRRRLKSSYGTLRTVADALR
mgnify:CR=1 FL=1